MNEERFADAQKIHAQMLKQNPSIADLKKMMEEAAEEEDYPKAIFYREEIKKRSRKVNN